MTHGYPGRFLTLEGGEGGGKSTQLATIEEYLSVHNVPHATNREPGGTRLGDAVREILLMRSDLDVHPREEALLFNAARHSYIKQIVEPALQQGKLFVSDRFADSTRVYQGFGGLHGEPDEMLLLDQIINYGSHGIAPDRTLVLDVPYEVNVQRRKGQTPDRIEQKARDFHERVREGFLDLADIYPDRIFIIDATGTKQEVFEQIRPHLKSLVKDIYEQQ